MNERVNPYLCTYQDSREVEELDLGSKERKALVSSNPTSGSIL